MITPRFSSARRHRFAAVIASCALLATACGGSSSTGEAGGEPETSDTPQSMVKVELGSTTRSLAILSVLHALQAGYFKDEGLDVNFQPPNAKSADVALGTTNGASDIAVVGSTATLVAASTGRGVVGVAAVAQSPTVILAITKDALQKLKDKGIDVTVDSPLEDRLKALGELTLGVPPQGSSGQVVLRYTLEQNGLDPDKILNDTRNLADGAALATAARQGIIDGYLWSPPDALLPEAEGFGHTWINWASGVPATQGINFTDVVTSESYAKENPEVLNKFMKALARASKEIENSPEKVAEAVKAEWFPKIEDDIYALSFEAVRPAFVQGITPSASSFPKLLEITNAGLKEPVSLGFDEVYDPSFATDAG